MLRPTSQLGQRRSHTGANNHNAGPGPSSSSSSSSVPMSNAKSNSPTYTTLNLPPTAVGSGSGSGSGLGSGIGMATGASTSTSTNRYSPRASSTGSGGGGGGGTSAQYNQTHGYNMSRGPASSSSTADHDDRERELDAAFDGYGYEGKVAGWNVNVNGKALKHPGYHHHPHHPTHGGHGHGNNNKYQRFSSPASSTHSVSSPLVTHGSHKAGAAIAIVPTTTTTIGNGSKRSLATKKDRKRLTLTKAEARRLKFSGTGLGGGESGDEVGASPWDGIRNGKGRRLSSLDKGKGKAVDRDGLDVEREEGGKGWTAGEAIAGAMSMGGVGKRAGQMKTGGKSKKGKHGHRHDIADGLSVSASASARSDGSISSSEHTEEEISFPVPISLTLALTRQSSPSSVHSHTRSNDSRSRRERERHIPQPPPHTRVEDAMDDAPLPEGMDSMDVEDVFFDDDLQGNGVPPPPTGETRHRDRNGARADWESDDEDDEAILFAALNEMSDTAQSNNGDEDSDDEADSSDEGATSDEDDLMDGFGGRLDSPFGFGDALPLVLMEDWSGNLVFAQPRVGSDGTGEDTGSRSTSKSRSKNGKSKSGSKAGSAATEDTTAIVVDAEAMEEWDDREDEEALIDDGGDTTDSLPDEDMPSPPDVIPFSLAAAGLEANNAAFGVTTVDEAALARDLGLPLADARSLLERAMQEEQQQLLASVAAGPLDHASEIIIAQVCTPDENHPVSIDGSSNSGSNLNINGDMSSSGSPASMAAVPFLTSPLPGNAAPMQMTPVGPVASGPPQMGSFLPSSTDPKRVAVIDGTGKATPSPFLRRGVPTTRLSKRGGGSSSHKKRTVGEAPLSPTNKRQRHSSVPAPSRGQFPGLRGSPLRQRANPFDREDTPSDVEEAPAAPISIDDVLDTSALNQFDAEFGDVNNLQSRHLRNLRRWDRVPVTTFRQSRTPIISFPNGIGPGVFGGGRTIDYGSSSSAGLRDAFSSPTAVNPTLSIDPARGQALFGQTMVISPILGPIDEFTYASRGSPESKSMRDQRENRGERTKKHNKLRTASMGDMPALHLS